MNIVSKESYLKECRRIRQNRENVARFMREQEIKRMFPQNEERAISIAREMGRNSNGMNRRADGIENYFVK